MPSCHYYDEDRSRCERHANENLDELVAENAKLRDEVGTIGLAAYLYGKQEMNEIVLRMRDEIEKLREVASLMAVKWLPNDVRMTPAEWHVRDERIRSILEELGIEAEA